MAEQTIGVIGAGSFGAALAAAIARAGHNVLLWAHKAQRRQTLREQFEGSVRVTIVDNREQTLAGGQLLLVTPSHTMVEYVQWIAPRPDCPFLLAWASKGFAESGQLFSRVFSELLPKTTGLAYVSGPTFATEVAANLPTAMEVASDQADSIQRVSEWFSSPHFRTYPQHDLIAAQVGGASKNVLAIAVGVAEALAMGANSRAALITRGIAEMGRLVTSLGGSASSLMGLSGLGDLVLTATDPQSRNWQFGHAIGQGHNVTEAIGLIGHQVEGYVAAERVEQLRQQYELDLPISHAVYQILYEGVSVDRAVGMLINRPVSRV